jgi:hypothetical protein
MTDAQKIEIIQTLLEDGCEAITPDKLQTYLTLAGNEILSWRYHLVGGVPDGVTTVPERFDGVHVYAVVAGYTHAGAEGESTHNENGINRVFMYSDMLDYIHDHVLPLVRVGAVN